MHLNFSIKKVVTAERHYRYYRIIFTVPTALPREIFPIPAVITIVTAVLPLSCYRISAPLKLQPYAALQICLCLLLLLLLLVVVVVVVVVVSFSSLNVQCDLKICVM